jgi:hypothetical protein
MFRKYMYLSSPSERRVYLEVKNTESHEGDDSGDDELGQVVVEEDIVDVHPEVGREHTHHGSVVDLGCVCLLVIPRKK